MRSLRVGDMMQGVRIPSRGLQRKQQEHLTVSIEEPHQDES
jgi:hypothetical protein